MHRLILDTNIWLDWLLFEDTGIAPHPPAAGGGPRGKSSSTRAGEAELADVLTRKFARPQPGREGAGRRARATAGA